MLLVIDVGNSNTVLGLYDGPRLEADWRVVTGNYRTTDELRMLFAMLFQQDGIPRDAVTACCIASVVPPLDYALEAACKASFGTPPMFVGPGVKTGISVRVENPKEVGADRIANAVGALESHGGPLIIVDFGTATTFDAISADAEYLGGAIVPGIQISADALFTKAAKLPRVDLALPPQVIGRDTVTHIRAGLTYGYADLTDGLITRMRAEMEGTPVVVATGGFAPLIAKAAKHIAHIDPLLTLKGLRAIYARNQAH